MSLLGLDSTALGLLDSTGLLSTSRSSADYDWFLTLLIGLGSTMIGLRSSLGLLNIGRDDTASSKVSTLDLGSFLAAISPSSYKISIFSCVFTHVTA